jgi:hypothetical protein
MPSVTDLIEWRNQAAAAEHDAQEADTRAQAASSELAALEPKRTAAATRLNDAQATLAAVQQAIADLPQAQAAAASAAQALADVNAQLAEVDARIAAIEAEIEQLRQGGQRIPPGLTLSLRQLQQTRGTLEQRQQRAGESDEQARERVARLQAQAAQLPAVQAAVDAASTELAALDQQRASLALTIRAATTAAGRLRARAQKLRTDLQGALDGLFAGLRTDVPIVLLPVRLETRFRRSQSPRVPSELLIRVYPDDIHRDTHEPGLTMEEERWGKHFWRETWRAGRAAPSDPAYASRRAQELSAWRQLATRFGAARAAYVAHRLTPSNDGARPAATNLNANVPLAVEPQFDGTLTRRTVSWTRAAQARGLPDRWLAIASRAGTPDRTLWGDLIPTVLPTGPDPSAAPPSGNDPQPAVPVDPGMRWMVDFAAAERVGMALRMTLTPDEAANGFDRLMVVGVKGTLADPQDGARELRALLEAHRFTWGCGFVPQGTPTNNSDGVAAGYSREDVGFERSFALEREARALTADADGTLAAAALGLAATDVAPLTYADGYDQRDAANFNRVLWPVTLGYFLRQFLNEVLPGPDHEAWRTYFVERVRARGPLPALRIGRQPYGLLPVTALDRVVTDRPDLVQLLRALRDVWRASVNDVARAGRSNQVGRDLVEILGAAPMSMSYTVRWARGPRFFDLFWALPGQQINPTTLATARQTLRANLLAVLQRYGLSEGASTRLLATTFAPVALPWNGPLVEATEPSDTEPLRHNYLRLFADNKISLSEIHDDGALAAPPGTTAPLLYRLLRHATLLAYADEALRAWTPSTLVVAAPWFEPELVDMDRPLNEDRPGDPFKTPTFWRALQVVRGGAAESDGDRLRHAGLAVNSTLRDFLVSLAAIAELPTAALARLLGETLDLASHRLDAWITSVATNRLAQLRAAQPAGLYLGGYAWVENLRPRQAAPLSDGYVHAPSIAQATTAAVLRSGYLAHRDQSAGAQLALDLSSRRVRLAERLLDGVRQGQPLGALLGYMFERSLHERGVTLNRFIAPLRQLAPLVKPLAPVPVGEPLSAVAADNVVDGLKLVELHRQSQIPFNLLNPNNDERTALDAAFGEIVDAVDAIGDLAIAEGVHQAVQGNYLRAGASLDAISRGETPTERQFVPTPQSGVAFTHRVAMLFNTGAAGPTTWNRKRARAVAEPVLNGWAEQLLGPPERVMCKAAFFRAGRDPMTAAPDKTIDLFFSDLRLCALDVVYAAAVTEQSQQTDVELQLARIALTKKPATLAAFDVTLRLMFARTADMVGDSLTFPDVFELARVARELIGNGRPLDARDLAGVGMVAEPGTAVDPSRVQDVTALWTTAKNALHTLFDVTDRALLDRLEKPPFDLPSRLVGVRVNLLDLADLPRRVELVDAAMALEWPDAGRFQNLRDALDAFAAFAVRGAVPSALAGKSSDVRRDLVLQATQVWAQVRAIDSALTALSAARPADAAARFALLFGEGFRVLPSFTPDRASDIAAAQQRRVAAGDAEPEVLAPWLHTSARVRDGVRRLTAALTYTELAGTANDMRLAAAQYPFGANDRWNAPVGPAAAIGGTSLVMYAPSALDFSHDCAGLLVDEWVEVVPNPAMQTALAFHYDAPGAQAPQAVLLAVPPDPTTRWDVATLAAVVTETVELSKLRAVDYDALTDLGHFLPAVLVANNTGGDPHGDTVSSDLNG